MLKSVEIQNFRSIKQLTLDLTYGLNKAPNGYKQAHTLPFIEMSKQDKSSRIVPCFIMYGANASGKTNILRAIDLMVSLLKDRFNPKLHYQPNLIIEELGNNLPTRIACNFYIEACLFKYEFSVDRHGILKESLYADGKVIFMVENARLVKHRFERKDTELKDTFNTRCVDANSHAQVKCFFNAFSDYLPGVSEQVNKAYAFLTGSLVIIPNAGSLNFFKAYESLFGQTTTEKAVAIKEDLKNYVTKLDFNIIDFELQEEAGTGERLSKKQEDSAKLHLPLAHRYEEDQDANGITTSHLTDHNREIKLNFSDESVGTQKSLVLLMIFLKALKTGQTVLIDELDNSIHTFLLKVLIKIFTERESNSHQSQLIANVQNTELLRGDLLSSSELGFISYSKKAGSTLYRPVDDKQIRKADNFHRAYLRGDWGGIPFPYI